MTSPKPHYLLFCDGNVSANGENAGSQRGRWRFVLENLVSGERIEATDQEIACAPDRSALVAVLRGLEALEQPSRVTLVTTSRYVTRGLQYGLSEWRDNDYSWEHFGAVQPIRNADIWKRIDRALAYHQVQCRWMAQEGVAEQQDELRMKEPVSKRGEEGRGKIEEVSEDGLDKIQDGREKIENGRDGRATLEHGGDRRTTLVGKNGRVGMVVGRSGDGKVARGDGKVARGGGGVAREHGGDRRATLVESQKGKSRKKWLFVFQSLCVPVYLVRRGIHLLCNHSWDAVLAVDEWLESFLRCLLLLDPSKKTTRRQWDLGDS